MAQPPSEDVHAALGVLRHLLGELDFPFDSPAAAAVRRTLDDAQTLLDIYLLPRIEQMDAPLLVAVGGSTGGGKSTLINSMVGEIVSAPGVLRPTTRIPVLVHHPDEMPSFAGDQVLVERQTANGVPKGLVLIDTPPLGSIAGGSRLAALSSLAAADLWLFVTTAARYADAVPWDALTEAADRRVVVGVVINRVPSEATTEVRSHLAGLLAERGFSDAPLFTLEEAAMDSSGMMPPDMVEPVSRWLHETVADDATRAAVVERTVTGAVDHVLRQVSGALAQAEVDVFDDDERAALTNALADVAAARGGQS